MSGKKKEGVLTAVKVMILFRIQECWDANGLPPRLNDLAQLPGRVYTASSVKYHLEDLIKWGYVLTSPLGEHRHWGWRLSELGRNLVDGSETQTVGKGEVR